MTSNQAAVTSAAGQAAATPTLSGPPSPVTRSTCSSAPQHLKGSIAARHSRSISTRLVSTVAALLLLFTTAAISVQVPEAAVAIAYDPLEPVPKQLKVPLIAGVPPSSIASEQARQQQQEQTYRQRLEKNRAQQRGQFYEESSRKVLDHSTQRGDVELGGIETAKEPLPWEGMKAKDESEDNRSDLDQDDFLSNAWVYSPWEDSFRFKADDSRDDDDDGDDGGGGDDKNLHNNKAAGRHVWSMESQPNPKVQSDSDDGAAVVEGQDFDRDELLSPVEDSDLESEKETGRLLKVEEEGRFGTETNTKDPNVRENQNEIIVPEVWDADGVSQKGETGKQEYVETEEETVDGTPVLALSDAQSGVKDEEKKGDKSAGRAPLDQRLQKQAAIKNVWKAKHPHQHMQRQRSG
ncbi:hypothetical protein BGZ72_009068 [Mortierella alpina]|nr:hypothetical protein BGZ72_009068 [Mortierella alpina]